jgi:periplasmic divalent cation tolerance protein
MYIVILVTAKDVEEADKIAAQLVQDKLVACANIVEGVRSVFRWQGKVDGAREVLLILKSKKDCFSQVVAAVEKLHSYAVPEIIALPIIDGNQDYLNWINQSCRVP